MNIGEEQAPVEYPIPVDPNAVPIVEPMPATDPIAAPATEPVPAGWQEVGMTDDGAVVYVGRVGRKEAGPLYRHPEGP